MPIHHKMVANLNFAKFSKIHVMWPNFTNIRYLFLSVYVIFAKDNKKKNDKLSLHKHLHYDNKWSIENVSSSYSYSVFSFFQH